MEMTNKKLTCERLREVLDYEPDTGLFRRKIASGANKVGSVAGTVKKRSCQIGVDRTIYVTHRLAWLWMTGEWPALIVDHRDGDPHNNRWNNLRLATPTQNAQNSRRRKSNRLGLKGVRQTRFQISFGARITVNGVRIELGCFNTAEEAHAAYCEAARKYHGEFARFE